MSQHCKCRHNTHSLTDTGEFDWVIRSKLPDKDVNVKLSISIICQDKSHSLWNAVHQVQVHGASLHVCYSLPMMAIPILFTITVNTCELKMSDGICEVYCPPGMLSSLCFISKPAGTTSCIRHCIPLKSSFFILVIWTWSNTPKKSHIMLCNRPLTLYKSFKRYCLTSHLPITLPVSILCRYVTGCPPVYKRLLMDRLQVWRQPLIGQWYSNFGPHSLNSEITDWQT